MGRVYIDMAATQEDRPHLSRDWLVEMYWEKEMSLKEMAEIAGVTDNDVLRSMRRRDVETRSPSEAAGRPRTPDEKIRLDVERVAGKVGGRPTTTQYEELGEYSCNPVLDRWGDGSWAAAMEEIDL